MTRLSRIKGILAVVFLLILTDKFADATLTHTWLERFTTHGR
jgi:hypothetical protein